VVSGETSYTFHHVLVRDVAYGQIPRAARADKHERAAEWLETATNRRQDLAEMIAHHYQSALDLARAAGRDEERLVEHARTALRDAGRRAAQLNAHAAARRYYEAALELWPEGDPERPELLLGYGRALAHADQAGADVLQEARERLATKGNLAGAAEADIELSDLLRVQGRHNESFAVLLRARELLEDAPPSRPKAHVLSKLSAFLMFADRNEEAIRVGFQALEMAEELELTDVRAHALNNIGFARAALGDRGGVVDLERSIAIAVESNSPEALRGYVNLGSAVANLGDLRRAFELYREGRRLAERFGDARGVLWFSAEEIYECYWTGRWNDALSSIEQLVEEGRTLHATLFDSRLIRGWIRLARGDDAGALDDASAALEAARGGEAQYLYPALSFQARTFVAAGLLEEASSAVTEALEQWMSGAATFSSFWLADLAVAALARGRASELVEGTDRALGASRWVDAARAYAEARFGEAALLYAEIGSAPDEAFARLRAAETLARKDRNGAEQELARALTFFRSVGAEAYAREAEAVLATA